MCDQAQDRVLVIAAHPDDEVLGCGGAIARLAREGHEVHIAILGEGVTSRYQGREKADQTEVRELRARAHEVAALLGARDLIMCDLPDNRFDTIPLLDVVKTVEGFVDGIRPRAIYTHHGGDLNIDHAVVHRAVLTATRPIPGCSVKDIYTFEVPSSTEWSFGQFATPFQPLVFVDIRETLGVKLQAMQLYGSECRAFPHPRSSDVVKAMAQRWGSVVGLQAVEAFGLVRSVRQAGGGK